MTVRIVAFYLPQFHPIPENNLWWGPGFTEWTNVACAKPQFPRHYQPHIPRDLGFYDLRLSETREAQADLAQSAGVDAFCYYRYWFNGRKLLQQPLDEVVTSGRPSLPFCVCWANEDWTRSWDGRSRDYLLRQHYSREDDLDHIRDLLPALADGRYLRVGGKRLLLVYRAQNLPEPERTAEVWRSECQRAGLGALRLCCVNSMVARQAPPAGFDAAVEFEPNWSDLPAPLGGKWGQRLMARSFRRGGDGGDVLRVYRYDGLVDVALRRPPPDYAHYPCVVPGWDNTPRRGAKALVFHGSTPKAYERWLATAVARQAQRSDDVGMVFINAWNEWGEGAHLEPCLRWGRAYLDATARVSQTESEGAVDEL